jgi:2-oxoglutarate ferredoxin oxidoreductase subunit alpha
MPSKPKVLMYGNDAIAEAAIRAGCTGYFGYPITPQNELINYMSEHMPKHNRVFIQAESELASINMVYGAAAAGGKVMTSSSSPGISLKQEGISYLAGAELPCVIVNIVRGGPGLGNIAPAQSDYFQSTRGGGHGDYRTIALAPDSVQEAVDLTVEAFDLADKYRNPVLVVGDGIIGQMREPVSFPSYRPVPRKPAKNWIVEPNPTGRRRRRITSIYLDEHALEDHNLKLQKKFTRMEQQDVKYEELNTQNADIVVVAYGTCARVVKGAITLGQEKGFKIGLIRPITLWPFPTKRIRALAQKQHDFLVVEMSLGQMIEDVQLAVGREVNVTLHGRTGGGVPTSEEVLAQAIRLIKKKKKRK